MAASEVWQALGSGALPRGSLGGRRHHLATRECPWRGARFGRLDGTLVREFGTEVRGLSGWGVILNVRQGDIRWRPVFPSDYLKMDLLFYQDLSDLVDSIRGRFRRATMWKLSGAQVKSLRKRIRELVVHPAPELTES